MTWGQDCVKKRLGYFFTLQKKKQQADPLPVWMGLYTKPVLFSVVAA